MDHTNLSPQDIQNMYELPHFQNDLHRFLYDRTYIAPWHAITPVACISTWSRVRMQLKDPQDVKRVLPPVTVEASPPMSKGKTFRAGRYNFVLLQRDAGIEDIGIQGDHYSATFCF